MKKRLLTGILAAAAVTGLISMISAAETLEYIAPEGDIFTYKVDEKGVNISKETDNGD